MSNALQRTNYTWAHLTTIVIAVLVVYARVFHAPFAQWDDGDYVVSNRDIHGIDWDYISAWFSKFYIGNYHPLTMLSYAIDHSIGAQSPFYYHLTNILLHLANALVLYALLIRVAKNNIVALFTALLFALHPMQSESVAWIAERKTVLCAFFYLLALLQYTRYVAKPSLQKFTIVFLLSVAAMLSKGIAVAIPLSLIAVDIWLQRDMRQTKLWLEKLPFIVVSVVVGIVAIKAQAAGQFLGLHPEYTLWDSILLASYAYVSYIVHLLMPVKLSVIYPYPQSLGWLQYLCLVVSAGIVWLGVLSWRRQWYILCGGIIFYTVNIALLLQLVQVGESLMADRYAYIAGIGLLLPLVYCTVQWLQGRGQQLIAIVCFSVLAVASGIATFYRNNIWLSDKNFFSAILRAYPNSAVAQYSVGALYMKEGNYAEANNHMELAVILDPGNYKAWYNKGALNLREGKITDALEALNKCLAIKPYSKAYFSRALLYTGTGRTDLAIADADKVLEADEHNARAWYIKADCKEQQGDSVQAIEFYNNAILYEDNEPLFYTRRGLLLARSGKFPAALSDINNAVALDPRRGETIYYRGMVKQAAGQSPCADLRTSLSLGYQPAQQGLEKFCVN